MCHAIEDTSGRFLGAMLVARNLGYLSQVHSTLNYSRKLAALGRLMAGVAHEVKNPLNAMTIHLELLKQKLGGGARADHACRRPSRRRRRGARTCRKHVNIIGDEIRRLDEVVDGFLKFARPDELKLQPVQLAALITDVVVDDRAGGGAARRHASRSECPATLPEINADPGMLRQALLNLALNACQAMPDGGTLKLACRAGAAAAGRDRRRGHRRRHPARESADGSSICISRPRRRAAASACRWSTASSSCTTAKSKCSRPRAAERDSGCCSRRRKRRRVSPHTDDMYRALIALALCSCRACRLRVGAGESTGGPAAARSAAGAAARDRAPIPLPEPADIPNPSGNCRRRPRIRRPPGPNRSHATRRGAEAGSRSRRHRPTSSQSDRSQPAAPRTAASDAGRRPTARGRTPGPRDPGAGQGPARGRRYRNSLSDEPKSELRQRPRLDQERRRRHQGVQLGAWPGRWPNAGRGTSPGCSAVAETPDTQLDLDDRAIPAMSISCACPKKQPQYLVDLALTTT